MIAKGAELFKHTFFFLFSAFSLFFVLGSPFMPPGVLSSSAYSIINTLHRQRLLDIFSPPPPTTGAGRQGILIGRGQDDPQLIFFFLRFKLFKLTNRAIMI